MRKKRSRSQRRWLIINKHDLRKKALQPRCTVVWEQNSQHATRERLNGWWFGQKAAAWFRVISSGLFCVCFSFGVVPNCRVEVLLLFWLLTSRKAARPKRKKPQTVTGRRVACRRIQPERNRHNASRSLEPQTKRHADVNNRAIEVSTSRTQFYTAVKQYGDRYWFTYRMAQSKSQTGTRSTRLACFHKDCRFSSVH